MQGMSYVEIGHTFVVFLVSIIKIQGEPEQNERIYGYQVNGYSQADSSSHALQKKFFHTELRPLMGERVDGTIEERSLWSFW